MSSFTRGSWFPTGEPKTIPDLCVDRGFRFYIGEVGTPWFVDIEQGFVFNVSLPAWALGFMPYGTMEIPAAVHDRCRKNPLVPLWLGDLIFLHAMWVYGTPRWAAIAAYLAVTTNKRRD